MWFLLRMTLWLGIVLVCLPTVGSQPLPKSQVSANEALQAAKILAVDIQHFCQRQREACDIGSQASITLGQRAQAGAKMLYEFFREQFGSDESPPERTTRFVPVPRARPSQHTLQPADLVPPWRGPQPTDTPRDNRGRAPGRILDPDLVPRPAATAPMAVEPGGCAGCPTSAVFHHRRGRQWSPTRMG
jgi:Family of unknown function (DUF5330)